MSSTTEDVLVTAVLAIAKILLILAVGVLSALYPRGDPLLCRDGIRKMSKICNFLFLPFLVFSAMGAYITAANLKTFGPLIIAQSLAFVLSLALAEGCQRLLRVDAAMFRPLKLAIAFPNAGTVPLLLMESLCEQSLVNADYDSPAQCFGEATGIIFIYLIGWHIWFFMWGFYKLGECTELDKPDDTSRPSAVAAHVGDGDGATCGYRSGNAGSGSCSFGGNAGGRMVLPRPVPMQVQSSFVLESIHNVSGIRKPARRGRHSAAGGGSNGHQCASGSNGNIRGNGRHGGAAVQGASQEADDPTQVSPSPRFTNVRKAATVGGIRSAVDAIATGIESTDAAGGGSCDSENGAASGGGNDSVGGDDGALLDAAVELPSAPGSAGPPRLAEAEAASSSNSDVEPSPSKADNRRHRWHWGSSQRWRGNGNDDNFGCANSTGDSHSGGNGIGNAAGPPARHSLLPEWVGVALKRIRTALISPPLIGVGCGVFVGLIPWLQNMVFHAARSPLRPIGAAATTLGVPTVPLQTVIQAGSLLHTRVQLQGSGSTTGGGCGPRDGGFNLPRRQHIIAVVLFVLCPLVIVPAVGFPIIWALLQYTALLGTSRLAHLVLLLQVAMPSAQLIIVTLAHRNLPAMAGHVAKNYVIQYIASAFTLTAWSALAMSIVYH